jgi:hypothetical protein
MAHAALAALSNLCNNENCQTLLAAAPFLCETAVRICDQSNEPYLVAEAATMDLNYPDPATVYEFLARQRKLVDTYITDATYRLELMKDIQFWHQPGVRIEPRVFYVWQHIQDLTLYSLSRTQQTQRPLTIAVDLDGCLYDFNNMMRDWLITRGWNPDQLTETVGQYYTQRTWNIPDDVFYREMLEALEHGVLFREGSKFPEAIRSVRRLGEAGHIILANTARNFEGMENRAATATMAWLRDNGIHPDAVHLADPTDPKDKLSQPFDLLVDDHPGNVEAALEAGRSAVLLNRPWNLTYTHLPRAIYPEIARDPYKYLINFDNKN